jgi:RNA polymerase sigma-70 factor (ECF subfamily)
MPPSIAAEPNNSDVIKIASGNYGTDEELVAAAQNGGELAFEMLIKRYQSRIFAVALRYTRVHEDAEDVVQQALQKAFVHLRKFQGKSSFSTWLTRIAINESLMLLRRNRVACEIPIDEPHGDEGNRELEAVDPTLNPEVRYLQQEAGRILSSAIAELRPGMRRAVALRELQELSGSETARKMGVSLSAVKARVFQGRRKLREILRRSLRLSRTSRRTILTVGRNFSAGRKVA